MTGCLLCRGFETKLTRLFEMEAIPISRIVQFTDEFRSVKVNDLYHHGLMGPKWDRGRRHTGPSATYQVTAQLGTEYSVLRAQLEAGSLFVTGTMLDSTERVRLLNYSKGLFGGTRQMFECPACQRRCSVLYVPAPWSLIKPDGKNNQRRLLCKHCHGLRTPSWRYHGGDPGRGLHQRRRLKEQLGENPAERPKGCSTTRHQKRLARWLQAEARVLNPMIRANNA